MDVYASQKIKCTVKTVGSLILLIFYSSLIDFYYIAPYVHNTLSQLKFLVKSKAVNSKLIQKIFIDVNTMMLDTMDFFNGFNRAVIKDVKKHLTGDVILNERMFLNLSGAVNSNEIMNMCRDYSGSKAYNELIKSEKIKTKVKSDVKVREPKKYGDEVKLEKNDGGLIKYFSYKRAAKRNIFLGKEINIKDYSEYQEDYLKNVEKMKVIENEGKDNISDVFNFINNVTNTDKDNEIKIKELSFWTEEENKENNDNKNSGEVELTFGFDFDFGEGGSKDKNGEKKDGKQTVEDIFDFGNNSNNNKDDKNKEKEKDNKNKNDIFDFSNDKDKDKKEVKKEVIKPKTNEKNTQENKKNDNNNNNIDQFFQFDSSKKNNTNTNATTNSNKKNIDNNNNSNNNNNNKNINQVFDFFDFNKQSQNNQSNQNNQSIQNIQANQNNKTTQSQANQNNINKNNQNNLNLNQNNQNSFDFSKNKFNNLQNNNTNNQSNTNANMNNQFNKSNTFNFDNLKKMNSNNNNNNNFNNNFNNNNFNNNNNSFKGFNNINNSNNNTNKPFNFQNNPINNNNNQSSNNTNTLNNSPNNKNDNLNNLLANFNFPNSQNNNNNTSMVQFIPSFPNNTNNNNNFNNNTNNNNNFNFNFNSQSNNSFGNNLALFSTTGNNNNNNFNFSGFGNNNMLAKFANEPEIFVELKEQVCFFYHFTTGNKIVNATSKGYLGLMTESDTIKNKDFDIIFKTDKIKDQQYIQNNFDQKIKKINDFNYKMHLDNVKKNEKLLDYIINPNILAQNRILEPLIGGENNILRYKFMYNNNVKKEILKIELNILYKNILQNGNMNKSDGNISANNNNQIIVEYKNKINEGYIEFPLNINVFALVGKITITVHLKEDVMSEMNVEIKDNIQKVLKVKKEALISYEFS